MGYMRHHAIIVTMSGSLIADEIAEAHTKALLLFEPGQVSPISPPLVNGYRSFAIFPDGSKEGWPESAAGDAARDAFVQWMEAQRYDDGSTSYKWAEIFFGDDQNLTAFVTHSEEAHRTKPKPGYE